MNNFGAKKSIFDPRDHVGTSTQTEFEDRFRLNMPSVKNQGEVGSCVAHAVSVVAEYFNKKETRKNCTLSTGYIYGNRLLSIYKGTGMYVRDALKTMTKFGDVTYKEFPENVEVPEAIQLFDNAYAEGISEKAGYQFSSYCRLNTQDSIKQHIKDVGPVIFSMKWFDDCEVKNGVMYTNCLYTKKTSSHCMVIYGWAPAGWLVQNSWGKEWGNKGCFVLPYDIPLEEAWGVTDLNNTSTLEIKKPFSSSVGQLLAKIIHKVLCFISRIKEKYK